MLISLTVDTTVEEAVGITEMSDVGIADDIRLVPLSIAPLVGIGITGIAVSGAVLEDKVGSVESEAVVTAGSCVGSVTAGELDEICEAIDASTLEIDASMLESMLEAWEAIADDAPESVAVAAMLDTRESRDPDKLDIKEDTSEPVDGCGKLISVAVSVGLVSETIDDLPESVGTVEITDVDGRSVLPLGTISVAVLSDRSDIVR